MEWLKKRIFLLLGVLLALVPIGLLTDSPAWGEWDLDYYKKVLGFVPEKIEKGALVNSPLPDYTLPGINPVVGYYISGIVGVLLLFGIYYLIYRVVKKKDDSSQGDKN